MNCSFMHHIVRTNYNFFQQPVSMNSIVLVKFSSIESFQKHCAGEYFSIDSNFNVLIGNFEESVELWDVYSPAKGLNFK